MAKKITIAGSNLLNDINDDWGGQNASDSPVTVYGTTIPPGAEWGMNRGEVERIIKESISEHETALGTKVGSSCFSPTPNASNHYELWGFANAEDQATYIAEYNTGEVGPATEALRLFVAELPIAATAVDTYSLTLSTSRTGSTSANPFVVKRGAQYLVPLRVLAWHYPANGAGDACAYDHQPQILIERSTNGTTWTTVGTAGVTGIADSLTDETFPNVVDIGKMIDTGGDGALMVRLSIPSYVYTNAAGETATMASNRVVLYLRTVTLGISMATTDWISPIRIGDSATAVPVKFTLQGNVAKTLHVKMTNASGTETYDQSVNNVTAVGEYNYTLNDDSGVMGIATSGVHTLTAWVTYGTGDDVITSDVIIHQLLVLKPSTADTVGQKVLVQQMAQTVDNFVQSTLCHYWVWNPKLEGGVYINDTSVNVTVRFIVADTPNLSEEHTEYVTLPVSVTPGTDCTLLATMEIETAISQDTYTARLHALNASGVAMLTPARQFVIDNTAGFQPTAGSVFHLNPKARDNDEINPKTIQNARNGNAEVPSVWSDTFKMDGSDGWVTDDDGEKVLLIPAGRELTIQWNPLNHFYTAPAPSKAYTMEFDFMIKNITNEDDPVIQLCEGSGTAGEFLGLRLRSMIGTMGCATNSDETTTDFRWAEGRRQHLGITITPSVAPNATGDARYTSGYAPMANGTINLVRVYLNGVIVRELRYNPNNQSEFCTGALSNGGIKFGQVGQDGRASGADVYIYGIRTWESGLSPKQELQNYISALPGSTEKRALRASNDITMDDNSGRISLPKACAAGKTCLIWHGVEVMYGDDSKKGWLEIRRYGYDGTYLPQYSGSFCKATKKLKGKGQGTTAMTYFYWNTQWKFGDIGYDDNDRLDPSLCITLAPSQINDNVHLGTAVEMSTLSDSDQDTFSLFDTDFTHVCPVYGGNLGKDEPVGTAPKYYPCKVNSGGEVTVIALPDGWVNGNGDLYDELENPTGGRYCGPCWQGGPGLPYSSKHVLKINYASSMQSHLIGINWLYDALHKAYCGSNSLQRDVPSACVAKQVVPVLFFTADTATVDADETDGTAVFRGLGGFGPGKMDKPVWGYNKKASKITDPESEHYRPNGHDYFAMFEGAVNNSVLSDMIAPWDDTDHLDAQGNVLQRAKVKYFLQDPSNPGVAKDPESFYYRHTVLREGVEVDSWEKGIGFDAGKTGRTEADGLLYRSSSCDDPENAPSAKITGILRNAWNYIYLHNPNVRYYNGTQDQLAAANLTEAERKRKWITRDSFLLKRWDFCERRWVDAGLWDEEAHAYAPIDIADVIEASSELRDDRQAVVDAYIAYLAADATPTNATETDGIGAYFKAKSLRFHYAFQNHFIAGTDNCSKNTYYVIDPVTHLIEMHQDDVDTTIATDNFGFQSKPYYVDRMNPYDDKDTVRAENSSCYDGMLNTLFDLVESMWADNGTIAAAVGSILTLMGNLTGGIGSSESASQDGVWRSLNRYLFDIQRYFPQVTFNETARIRYEFPAMLGFVGRDGEADPLAQSMGDQLEAEIQFMTRRLIYMASYAGFGEFAASVGTSTGSTGISDASAQLSVNSVALPNGGVPDQTFTVTPHQYLFPVFTWQSQTDATRHRTAPGEAFTYTTNFGFANTYPIALRGLNYYRSVGNLGDKTINATSFAIQGARLTEFIAEPTVYYSTAQGGGSISRVEFEALSDAEKANYAPAFQRASNLQIASGTDGATRLRKLSLNGCAGTGSTERIPLELSRLSMVEEIDLRGTAMQAVVIPQTATLTTLRLPKTMTAVSLTAQPNLSVLAMEGNGWSEGTAMKSLVVTGAPNVNTQEVVTGLFAAGATLSVLSLADIAWPTPPISAAVLRWMLDVSNEGVLELTGSSGRDAAAYDIYIATTTGNTLYYEDVDKMIRLFGDVRSADNPLRISFSAFPITQANLSIGGRKFYNLTVPSDWDNLSLEVAGGNNVAVATKPDGSTVPDVTWDFVELDTNGDYVIIDGEYQPATPTYASFADPYSPIMTVTGVQAQRNNVYVGVRVTVVTLGGTLIVVKKLGLWNRVPEVGDYAWADGTFDSENDPSKPLAGMVIMREWMDENDNIISDGGTDGENIKKYKLWVYGGANAGTPDSSDGTSASIGTTPAGYNGLASWGPYPSATDGITPAISGSDFADALTDHIQDYVAAHWQAPAGIAITLSTYYKTTSASYGFFYGPLPKYSEGDHYLRKNAQSGSGNAMQDESNQNHASAGHTTYASLLRAGDGLGYAIPTYASERNFYTEDENKVMMSFADCVLEGAIEYLVIPSTEIPGYDANRSPHIRTPQDFADVMQTVVRYCVLRLREGAATPFSASATYAVGDVVVYLDTYYRCSEAVETAGNFDPNQWTELTAAAIDFTWPEVVALYPARFRQLFYPAFRRTNVWCPLDIAANIDTYGLTAAKMDTQYARGKWMLPSSGLLARILNFLGNSRSGYNANAAPAEQYAEQSESEIGTTPDTNLEALKPIFANTIARGRAISVSSGSSHWSSTENSRNSARIVSFYNGYSNNGGKYGGFTSRPVAAFTFVP